MQQCKVYSTTCIKGPGYIHNYIADNIGIQNYIGIILKA